MELADQLSPGQWRPTSLAPVPALSPAERAVEQTSPSHAHSCPAHFSLRFAPHVGCPCKIYSAAKKLLQFLPEALLQQQCGGIAAGLRKKVYFSLSQRSIKSPLFLLARGREMGWRGYRYLLGMVLLVPTALILSVVWAWRRLRGGQPALEDGGTRQLRQGTSQELTIPSEAVGYVIGRQGQRVRELERTSGARIRFKDLQDSEDKVGPSLSLSLGCGQIEK